MDRKCTVCGQIKPISEFREDARTKDGYSRKCNACLGGSAEKIRGGQLEHITSRQLIEELRRRGYSGKLTYSREITV